MSVGRPTKLTPELQRVIVQALRAALYVETACDIAGISKDTFYNWLRQGQEKPYGKHGRFSDAVKKAQAEAEGRLIGHLLQDGTWQSKAWILERKFRSRWGRSLTVYDQRYDDEAPNMAKDMDDYNRLKKATNNVLDELD